MKQFVRLGDVCEISGGYAFKSIDFQNEGIPVVRISNINDKSVLLDDKTVFVDNVSQDILQKYSIHKGDILIALSGATTGKFGIYKEDTDALLNQRVAKLVPSSLVDNLYLYYYLNILTINVQNYFQLISSYKIPMQKEKTLTQILV